MLHMSLIKYAVKAMIVLSLATVQKLKGSDIITYALIVCKFWPSEQHLFA